MKKADRLRIFPALLEMLIIMIILMSAFEITKQMVFENASQLQWHLINIGYASLMAALISFFLLRIYSKHNSKMQLEIRRLHRMEEELKEKIAELSHFKDLVVWWEKRIDNLQNEMDTIKDGLAKHQQTDEPPLM